MPSFYTSFDDEHIVMDSYKSSVETTLQNSKTQAYGVVYPTFTISDTFTPDLDDTLFPYSKGDAPEIDGAVYLRDNTGLQPGNIVSRKVTDADDYDLWTD
mgnify:CR=1 FL=1